MVAFVLIGEECLILIFCTYFVNFAVFISISLWIFDHMEILGPSYCIDREFHWRVRSRF